MTDTFLVPVCAANNCMNPVLDTQTHRNKIYCSYPCAKRSAARIAKQQRDDTAERSRRYEILMSTPHEKIVEVIRDFRKNPVNVSTSDVVLCSDK